MSLGDLADVYIKEGWGRQVTQEEALALARKSVDEGLVIMPANQQEAEFICACCSDCCGMLSSIKYHPRPVDVVASNFCHIGVFDDRIPGRAIVVSAIDNLVKGSAGQALQNFNLMHGFEETTGLDQLALFP